MCWHKWDKWSQPIEATFVPVIYGIRMEDSKYDTLIQERYCKKCGKLQFRKV